MKMRIIPIMILLFLMVGGILTSQGATTFIGSTIQRVDPTQQTITFRTQEGQSWTLRVADPNLLTKEPPNKGDEVSLEIDLDGKVTKIVTVADSSQLKN